MQIDFHAPSFFLIAIPTCFFAYIGSYFLRSRIEKLMFMMGMIGIFIYSGIGASIVSVPNDYYFYYIIFLVFVTIGFSLGSQFGNMIFASINIVQFQSRIHKREKLVYILFLLFILTVFVRLLYPEFKLYNLFDPPSPDVRAYFFDSQINSGNKNSGLFEAVRNYAEILLFPFFLLGLYLLKEKRILFIFLVISYLYLNYVADGYLGRYKILLFVIFIFLVFWYYHLVEKYQLVLYIAITALLFVIFYKVYGLWRLGVELNDIDLFDFSESILKIIEIEFTYPTHFEKIYSYESQVDLFSYVAWIITLPIPKILIGSGLSMEINADISRLLFDQTVIGSGGAYILLASFFGESFFIYGKEYFWIHGVSMGFLFGFLSKLNKLGDCFAIVCIYFAIEFLILSRGGVGSVLPVIFNNFLLLYLFIFRLIVKK